MILILVTRIKTNQKQSKDIVTRDCYKGYSLEMKKTKQKNKNKNKKKKKWITWIFKYRSI